MRVKIVLAIIIISLLCCGCEEKQSNEQPTSLSQTSQSITEITTFATTTPPETVAEVTQDKTQYVEVSEGHEFIDFEFIEDYVGITNPAEVQAAIDAAAKALISSEFNTASVENIDLYSKEQLDGFLDESGNIKPVFNQAFVEDFDGDGNKETFILMDMPYTLYPDMTLIRNFLVFVDSNNVTEILYNFYNIDGTQLLNYGKNKQLIISSYGWVGADAITAIFGMKDNKAERLYAFRGSFFKTDCFLTGYGWQGGGDLMYFDAVALEYRPIVGEKLVLEDIWKMDTGGRLKAEFEEQYQELDNFLIVSYIGNKYYCFQFGAMDTGTAYEYENGQFVLADAGIRNSWIMGDLNTVINIDMGKAIEEMKKPVNP